MSSLPLHAQFRRILENHETHLVSPEALDLARLAFIAERTGWTYAEIRALPVEVATNLILFWNVKDIQTRSASRVEMLLERIGTHLQEIARSPQPELMSYRLERRLHRLLTVLVGSEDYADARESYARAQTDDAVRLADLPEIPDEQPLLALFERFLEKLFDRP